MNRTNRTAVGLCAVVLVACTGDGAGVDLANRDARCVSACTASEPRYEGSGRVCSTASRERCLDECEARIAGVPTVCQSCLAEDACFGPDGCEDAIDIGGQCNNNTCTITSMFGTCTFDSRDEASKQRCYQQVDPRREVACEAEFRPTTECAAVCS